MKQTNKASGISKAFTIHAGYIIFNRRKWGLVTHFWIRERDQLVAPGVIKCTSTDEGASGDQPPSAQTPEQCQGASLPIASFTEKTLQWNFLHPRRGERKYSETRKGICGIETVNKM